MQILINFKLGKIYLHPSHAQAWLLNFIKMKSIYILIFISISLLSCQKDRVQIELKHIPILKTDGIKTLDIQQYPLTIDSDYITNVLEYLKHNIHQFRFKNKKDFILSMEYSSLEKVPKQIARKIFPLQMKHNPYLQCFYLSLENELCENCYVFHFQNSNIQDVLIQLNNDGSLKQRVDLAAYNPSCASTELLETIVTEKEILQICQNMEGDLQYIDSQTHQKFYGFTLDTTIQVLNVQDSFKTKIIKQSEIYEHLYLPNGTTFLHDIVSRNKY